MTKVLITGGCGFIGSNLTEFILNKTDWEVSILDNLTTGRLENIESIGNNEKITFYEGSILNNEDIIKAIDQCEYVVNLAAQTSVLDSIKDPFEDQRQNIQGLLNLLTLSVNFKIKTFVQGSSAAVLGEQTMPIHGLKVPRPISPYGASKLAGEAYCSVFSNLYELNCVVLRFSNVYGPRSTNKTSVIAKFIKKLIRNELIEIYGDGNQTRDFLYVIDLCNGIYKALTRDIRTFELYHLGSGKETSINTFIETLKRVSSNFNLVFPKVTKINPKPGEIRQNYSDISKAIKNLDFHNKYDLEKGLNETLEWFLSNYRT